ncbi:MAG: DUF4175 family protein [bacterium]
MKSGNEIADRLARAWMRERLFFSVQGVLNLAMWLVVLLAADFVIDLELGLRGPARLLMLGGNAVIMAAVTYWTWLRWLKRYDPLRVALQVERLYPQLGSILVSYVQFSGGKSDENVSPALVEAMKRQAISQSTPLDFGGIVRFRVLRRTAAAAGGAVVLAVIAGIGWPGHLNVFIARMSSPAVDTRYPTRTVIDSAAGSGELVVQQGRTVLLRAVVGGVIPDQARLTIVPEQGRAETITVDKASGGDPATGEYLYRVEDVHRGFSYSFRAGDDSTPGYTVVVVPPPVVEPGVMLRYPDYCGRKPEELDTLSFELLEGATIRWTMKSDRPLAGAAIIREDGTPQSMSLSPDGYSASLELGATKSFSYGFQWTDRQNRFVYDPDIRYNVRVVPDMPPRVALLAPAKDEVSTTRKAVDILYEADDDYGIVSASVLYKVQSWSGDQKTEGDEKSVAVQIFDGPGREVRESFRWDLTRALPGLKAGDVVTYCLQVRDSRLGSPGIGRSSARRLTIVSDADYIRMAGDRRRDLLDRIKDLYQQEGKAADTVQSLKDKE